MANAEFNRMIELGQWLEKYLNPQIKPWEYKELVEDAVRLYNVDFAPREDFAQKIIDYMENLPTDVKDILYSPQQYARVFQIFKEGKTSGQEMSRDSLFENDAQKYSFHEKESLKGMFEIFLIYMDYEANITATAINMVYPHRPKSKKNNDKSLVYGFQYFYFFMYGTFPKQPTEFIHFKKKLASILEIIHQEQNPWAQTYAASLSKEIPLPPKDGRDPVSMIQWEAPPFGAVYNNSTKIFESIRIIDGVACKRMRLDTPGNFFPWSIITSKILIDFLFLGGQDYFSFCKQCHRFTAIQRKGRKKFCSDICRTAYRNKKLQN